MEFSHRSVLLWECIEALNIRPDGVYLDGTLGGAGHSLEICRNLTTGRLIGVDRDPVALEAATKRLQSHLGKVTLVHDNFENIASILERLGLDGVDGILLDLGVSSPQLDDGARGFSYMADAPLDMRMDRSQALTAYDVVNNWPRAELKKILFEYGEERYAPQIAAAIDRVRQDHPIETTLELVDVIRGAMPDKALREKQHPAKRSFQAIRIAVNDELGRGEPRDARRSRVLEARRTAGRHHVPFPRGSDREKRDGRGGKGLHLPAEFPGLRLRQQAEDRNSDEETHHRDP